MKIPLKFSRAKWRCKSSVDAAAGSIASYALSTRPSCYSLSPYEGEKNLFGRRSEGVRHFSLFPGIFEGCSCWKSTAAKYRSMNYACKSQSVSPRNNSAVHEVFWDTPPYINSSDRLFDQIWISELQRTLRGRLLVTIFQYSISPSYQFSSWSFDITFLTLQRFPSELNVPGKRGNWKIERIKFYRPATSHKSPRRFSKSCWPILIYSRRGKGTS